MCVYVIGNAQHLLLQNSILFLGVEFSDIQTLLINIECFYLCFWPNLQGVFFVSLLLLFFCFLIFVHEK